MEQDEYCLKCWSQDNFIVDSGVVKINYGSKPSLLEIVETAKKNNLQTPILIRFPHLIEKQVNELYSIFEKIIKQENYQGKFQAVFPLKVNQYSGFLNHFLKIAKKFNYGVEAGSKAELLLAISINTHKAPITVNGFKDKEMITLGFIALSQGHNITLIIEGLNELQTIIEVKNELKLPSPNIGLRLRLHSYGSGTWAKSGGINSKFGLSSVEILDAFEMIKENNLIENLKMIHFHIGSSMSTIGPLKKALKESGHIYVELKKMGANALKSINIGGGLGIEYSQIQKQNQYSLKEFASDVIFTLKDIALKNGVDEPDIFTESGRFIAASNTVLIAPVLELFSSEYEKNNLKLKNDNPDIIKELYELYNEINNQMLWCSATMIDRQSCVNLYRS